jgi:CubicO group peptidase (beta-lactamase class C family)
MEAGGLAAAVDRAAAIPRFRSLLVARHGRLVVERYFAGAHDGALLDVRSVTKSVVSALTGIALRDQVLPGIDAPIDGYLSRYALDDADRGITIRHLLTMTSGFEWNEDTAGDYNLWIVSDDRVQYLFDRPHVSPPGAAFRYNSAAVHVLGVVLQSASGMPLPQYANAQLFGALAATGVAWEALDRGTVNGGSGIELRGQDLLKLGQLFLQNGWSGERSLVPESWVATTTQAQFGWSYDRGPQKRITYGMLWWVSDAPRVFFAWGYGGQFVYVAPDLDVVVVTTTDWTRLDGNAAQDLAAQGLGVIVEGVLPAAR